MATAADCDTQAVKQRHGTEPVVCDCDKSPEKLQANPTI
jgi:hypothetical protein